jgi:hypothetical protein
VKVVFSWSVSKHRTALVSASRFAGLAAQGAFTGLDATADWRAYADRILALVRADKARA